MTLRRIRGAPRALAVLTLLAGLSLAPTQAARAAGVDGTDDSWAKVFKYARCVFSVFRAVTPADVFAAVLDCGTLYIDEAPGGRP